MQIQNEKRKYTLLGILPRHSVGFGYHSVMVVGFLHFNENQRKTIHKQRNVRTEVVFSIPTGKLRCKMESVILWIVKVNEPHRLHNTTPAFRSSVLVFSKFSGDDFYGTVIALVFCDDDLLVNLLEF